MFGKAQGVAERNLQMCVLHIMIINCWSSMDVWNEEKLVLISVGAN